MVSTAEGVQLIAAETGRLKEYVSGTDAEEWSLDSPCEGWTVGDVIGHLGPQSSSPTPYPKDVAESPRRPMASLRSVP